MQNTFHNEHKEMLSSSKRLLLGGLSSEKCAKNQFLSFFSRSLKVGLHEIQLKNPLPTVKNHFE